MNSRRRSWSAVVILMSSFGMFWLWLSPGWAFEVRVRGAARISVDVQPVGTTLRALGVLIDELGEPLPQREIFVGFRGADAQGEYAGQWLMTDVRGEFSFAKEVPPGRYAWKIEFPETPHLQGDTKTGVLQALSRVPRLVAVAPKWVVPDGQATVYLRSSIDGTGVPLTVKVSVHGEEVDSLRLDSRGLATFDLAPYLRSGRNEIDFVAPATRFRTRVVETTNVRRLDRLKLEARGQEHLMRLTRGVEVTGVISDRNGPIVGVDLDVFFKGAQRTRKVVARSDSSGRFEAFFPRTEGDEGIWMPSVVARVAAGETLRESLPEIELQQIRSARILRQGAWALLLVLLLLGGFRGFARFSWRWRRRADRQAREESLEDALQVRTRLAWNPGAVSQEGRAERTVSGILWDRWRDCPVVDATLEVRSSGAPDRRLPVTKGRFDLGELEEGSYSFYVEASGFLPGTIDVVVPHNGRFRNLRVNLVAVPLQIRELYRAWTRFVSGDDPWGRSTPREIETIVSEALDRSAALLTTDERRHLVDKIRSIAQGRAVFDNGDDPLEALTAVVEDAYFGEKSIGLDVWVFASELVKGLRARHSIDQEA